MASKSVREHRKVRGRGDGQATLNPTRVVVVGIRRRVFRCVLRCLQHGMLGVATTIAKRTAEIALPERRSRSRS